MPSSIMDPSRTVSAAIIAAFQSSKNCSIFCLIYSMLVPFSLNVTLSISHTANCHSEPSFIHTRMVCASQAQTSSMQHIVESSFSISIRCETVVTLQGVDALHLVGRQLEVEDVVVLGNVGGIE